MGEGRIGQVRGGGDKFHGNRDALFLLPDGRRWRGAPDEGLPYPQKALRRRCALSGNGIPSPLPLSLISGLPEIST